jgi:hypothetical protein
MSACGSSFAYILGACIEPAGRRSGIFLNVAVPGMSIHSQDAWSYRRNRSAGAGEYGFWSGDLPPVLGAHFHPEAQLTIVFAGARALNIRSQRWPAAQ